MLLQLFCRKCYIQMHLPWPQQSIHAKVVNITLHLRVPLRPQCDRVTITLINTRMQTLFTHEHSPSMTRLKSYWFKKNQYFLNLGQYLGVLLRRQYMSLILHLNVHKSLYLFNAHLPHSYFDMNYYNNVMWTLYLRTAESNNDLILCWL